jgi:EmrB/QacA subfamily drug resistance transporter
LINLKSRPCDDLAIRSTPRGSDCAKRDRGWVLAAAVLGSTMAFVDESVVNIALPRMEIDLATTLAGMQWVINAYTLCLSALLLIGGAAADQFGRRKIFLSGVVIFAAASLACGLAPGVGVLILARAIQGVGAALLIPCSLAIIGAAYGEKERGAAIGIWSGASAIAAGAGPLFGGWLVDHVSWRAIFIINPVLAVPTLLITARHVAESRDPQAPAGLDWTGAVLAFGGLGSLVYGLISASADGWGSLLVIGSVLAGSALLLAFLMAERRASAPMVPLALFRSAAFSGVNLLTLLLYGALGGAMFFLPFALIQVHGYSATAAGAVFLPFTLILGLLSKWGGGLVDRFGARLPLIVGPSIVALGLLLLGVPGSGGLYVTTYFLPMVVIGFGMAVTVAPLTTTVLNSVPQHQTGVASGINNAVASVASLLLIAILGSAGTSSFGHALDRNLQSAQAAPEVRRIVDEARGGFVMPQIPAGASEASRQVARAVLSKSFVETVRLVMVIAAGLALASALAAAFSIRAVSPSKPAA